MNTNTHEFLTTEAAEDTEGNRRSLRLLSCSKPSGLLDASICASPRFRTIRPIGRGDFVVFHFWISYFLFSN
ncbi:MAG: hypothetical protein ACYSSK_02220, partial [Planctomycetota bacterium]